MTTCFQCHRELSYPLDEYGDPSNPVCWDCFSIPVKDDPKIQEQIDDLEEEIKDLEGQIQDLEGDLYEKKDQLRVLKNGDLKKTEVERSQLHNWKLGKAKVAA